MYCKYVHVPKIDSLFIFDTDLGSYLVYHCYLKVVVIMKAVEKLSGPQLKTIHSVTGAAINAYRDAFMNHLQLRINKYALICMS